MSKIFLFHIYQGMKCLINVHCITAAQASLLVLNSNYILNQSSIWTPAIKYLVWQNSRFGFGSDFSLKYAIVEPNVQHVTERNPKKYNIHSSILFTYVFISRSRGSWYLSPVIYFRFHLFIHCIWENIVESWILQPPYLFQNAGGI